MVRPWWTVLLAVALAGCPPPLEPYCAPSMEALFVLRDIGAGDGASTWKRMTPTPERHSLTFAIEGRSHAADLYLSREGSLAGIVLVPGLVQEGRDDPRLVAFARTLARARFAVLVPEFSGVRDLEVRPSDVRDVADAFRYLVSRADLAPAGRAGIGAHSYAVGPALLAALEPDLRDRVRFIQSVGGYHDLLEVVTFFTTGAYREGPRGAWRRLAPNEYGKWVFVLSNLEAFSREEDRTALRAMAERRLADRTAPIDDLAGQLGPEGRSLFDLLSNSDPRRVGALFARLPEGIRTTLGQLTLAGRELGSLRTRVILVHGRTDPIIPYTESIALDARLPFARLFLVSGLSHVDLSGPGALDSWKLACAIDALLAERRLGPP